MNFSVRSAILSVVFFFGYIAITLVVGEWHPFSNFPMYNNFPNWAYVFYITDSTGNNLPTGKYFDTRSGSLAHQYYAACQHYGIGYGYDMESKEEMQKVGLSLLEQINVNRYDFAGDSLYLFKKTFTLVNGQIEEDSINIATVYVHKPDK